MSIVTMWWTGKAWPWLKTHWLWLAGGVGAVAALALVKRRPIEVVAPALAEADKKANEINNAADAAISSALAAEQARLKAIADSHSLDVKNLTADQRDRLPELVSDPEALNSFLLEVGKQARDS